MRWNCPHCGVTLALSEEKVGSGWSFSRCYKCGGFALIRRAEINIIKVDKAPPGESVLLPEGHEEPRLSAGATQNLATAQASAQASLAAAQASAAQAASLSAAQMYADSGMHPTGNAGMMMAAKPVIRPSSRPQTKAPPTPDLTAGGVSAGPPRYGSINLFDGFPEPLPENPVQSRAAKALPFAIGAAGVVAVASGIYLFVQGQALWSKARNNATQERTEQSRSPEHDRAMAPVSEVRPVDVVDQVHNNAMAPVRPEGPVPNPAPANEQTVAAPPTAPAAIRVRLRSNVAKLHSGPGLAFPVIAEATPDYVYQVSDWRERWFKIVIPETLAARNQLSPGQERSAWVRNDLVQLIPASKDSPD